MNQQRLIAEFLHPKSTAKQDPSPISPQSGNKMRNTPPRKCKVPSRHNIESGASPFLTLPVEIRLYIYRHLLISPNNAELHHCSKSFRLIPKEPWDCPLAIHPKILQTCWVINKEATPILYSENVFRRGYCCPRHYVVGRGHRMWPIGDTSPVSKVNFAYISRLHLFRDYDHWFRDGELKIFNDVPHLKDLDIHIDLNDCADKVNLQDLQYQTLKAIRPDLRSFKIEIRLDFHEKAHNDWLAKCNRKTENFSLHLDKKRELETWLEHEGLFTHRPLFWCFKTQRSEWCGPSCYIGFAFDDKRQRDYIDLQVWDDGEGKFGRLKTHEENASSLVLRGISKNETSGGL
ncbi:uncharacterized protein BKA55DRAFT_519550 [Fusarium redolens]|uniref:F-box domain-containing protein n=1 Tax=Fusarium redolens TaxID=48865 RepID=A0A9P9GIM6_FUSRE|nr:uncharacterized protein BKA55DRAFT_519550 [Fusarium redolens]KAH7240100.1 hypothetical protein BKA55DRAFT_519550 [Fusarium redolens]